MKEEVIKFDSSRINKNLLLSGLVVLFSIYLILKSVANYNSIYIIIAVVGILIFVPKLIFAAVVKMQNREFIIITKEGIIDKSELYSVGLMKWKDIQEINIKGKKSQQVIEIQLKNYNDMMTKMPWYKRFMLRVSKMTRNSSLFINFDYSDKSFDEAVKILDKNTREYMRRKVQYKSIY